MLSKEKRTAFNKIMDSYTRAPQFDIVPNADDLSGFDDEWDGNSTFPGYDNSCDYDDEAFAEGYGLPIAPFTEEDLRFLRDFVLGTAMYVEELEAIANEQSDDFWQARENAYRIVTALLIRHYEYELEG